MAQKMRNDGLLVHLRRWGLKVEAKDGWRYRGRPYNFYPRAIIAHHTASNRNAGNFASESTVTYGRPGLQGPLCHFLLGRDGTVKVIAAGYANHAGYGGPKAGIPANQANTYAIGIEAENDGLGEPWSKAQLLAYYRLCASLLAWMGKSDVNLVIGHKEWAPGRKPDPTGINMDDFRKQVKKALDAGPLLPTISLSAVQPGQRGKDVTRLKKKLRNRGYTGFSMKSDKFGLGMRRAYRKYQQNLGYTGRDADGKPGRLSLKQLGYNVTA